MNVNLAPNLDELSKLAAKAAGRRGANGAHFNGAAPDDTDPEAPWAEPVNILTELSAPPFTADDLPACLAEFPAAFALASGFDPSLTLSAALSVAAAALSDRFQIVGDSSTEWFQQSRLWVLAIGRPGAGKSPAQSKMLAPLWRLHKELDAQWKQDCARDAEGNEDGEKTKPPPRPRVIVVDATIEALSEVLRDNPRGVMIANDEFSSWLGGHDLYRKGGAGHDRGEWLRVFDGGPHTIERIQRGSVYIENWGASILSATTPVALAKLTRNLPEDGLIQRFIPIVVRNKVAAQSVLYLDVLRKRYEETIARLHGLGPRAHGGCVPLSIEAQVFLKAWLGTNQLQAEAFGALEPALEAHFAKYPTLILRITLILHAVGIVNNANEQARDPAAFTVALTTVEAAARFLKRASLHAVAVYLNRAGGSDAYDLARDTGRAILARGWLSVARRDLIQAVRAFRKAPGELQDATLRLFVELGWLRHAAGGYAKATPARYDVNPMLNDKFAALADLERERRGIVRELIAQAVIERKETRSQEGDDHE